MSLDPQALRQILNEVKDPELPFISIDELGILRDVIVEGNLVKVKITPTYSGCPAMKMIEDDIRDCLKNVNGVGEVIVEHVIFPAWTTDWLTEEAKEKLRLNGYTPPIGRANDLVQLPLSKQKIPCPFCGSVETEVSSEFGSTACKSLHRCKTCLMPFDYLKAI